MKKLFGEIHDHLQLDFADFQFSLLIQASEIVTEGWNRVNSGIRVLRNTEIDFNEYNFQINNFLYFTMVKPPNLSLTLLLPAIALSAGQNHQRWMLCQKSHSNHQILSRSNWECQPCMLESALWNTYYTWHIIYLSRLGERPTDIMKETKSCILILDSES